MKRRFVYISILFLMTAIVVLAEDNIITGLRKIWHESSFNDFADGQFENLVLEQKNKSQIRLAHPMQRVKQDSLISEQPRFVEYDSAGNFYATWVEQPDKNVFIQKYNPAGEKIGGKVQVNDTNSRYHSYHSALAVMSAAERLIVTWGDDRNYPTSATQTIAQLFDFDLNKIGANINISRDKIDRSNSEPAVIANSAEGTFWVFLRISGEPGQPKLFIQRCSLAGELIDEPFAVNPDSIFDNEWSPSALPTVDGGCVVVWSGMPEQGMVYPDIYGIRLSAAGKPIIAPQKINDDSVPNGHHSPDIAIDPLGNFLIAWSEWREYAGEFPIYRNIYGQYADSLMKPIRENFLISRDTKELRSDNYPDVEWKENNFVATWLSWDAQKREYDLFVNSWKYQPVFNGTYTSSIFDMGPSLGDPEYISWGSFTNGDTNSIKFQLRAAQELNSLLLTPWLGPADSMSYYINAVGDSINPILRNQRYIQYRALLETESISASPALYEVSINYAAYDTIAPEKPQNLQAAAGHSRVGLSWDANQEIDLMAYRIYRTNFSTEYSSLELATVFKPMTSFTDTSAVTGMTYYYVITAVDSNLNESNFSEQVMATPVGIIIFVDDSALPGGNGSKENPFMNIYNGLDRAVYGDSVFVFPGNYTENIVMKKGVVLKGSGARVTTIQGDKTQETAAFIISADEAVLQGFTIISPGSANSRPTISCLDCGLKISDNILVNYGSGTGSGPAILCAQQQAMLKETPVTTQLIITKNLFRSFGTTLLSMDSAHVVFNNNIVLNKKTGFQIGINLTFSEAVIRNNTFIFNGSIGNAIKSSLSNVVIANNIIFNPGESFDGLQNQYGQLHISYNDIWVGDEAYIDCSPGIGDIQADPLFINIDRDDFRLAENSPCIDAGNPDSIFNDVDGSRNDMGAFGGKDPIDLSMTLKLFRSVAISSASGFPGDTIKVSMSVDEAAGIARAKFTIEFDNSLLFPVRVEKTVLTRDFSLKSDFSQGTRLSVELNSQREIQSGKGSIADFIFTVNPLAQSQQSTPLTLESIFLVAGSGDSIEIKSITHGVFIVNYMASSENVIYVDNSYSGFEDGSPVHPYHTIAKGINHAVAGDTVFVSDGVYHEKLEINKGIFLKGAGAAVTSIEAGSDEDFVDNTIHLNTDEPCGISGVTITNKSEGFVRYVLLVDAPKAVITNNKIISNEMWPGLLVKWNQANGGILQSNYFHGGGECLEIRNADDLLIKNNRFISKSIGIYGVTCEYSNATILNNRFEVGAAAVGIQVVNSSESLIQNNIIQTVSPAGSGIFIGDATAQIINNTIVVYDQCINGWDNSSISVMNNILVGKKIGGGISSRGSAESNYNDVWNNFHNYNGLSPGEGDISLNPLFVDSLNGNFHLKLESPCIDAGNPNIEYNDLDGSRNDMGAFGGPMADTSGFLGRQIAVSFVNSQILGTDTLLIPIKATNLQNIANLEMNVNCPESQLKLLNVKQSELTNSFSLMMTKESSTITKVELSSPVEINKKSGLICELVALVQNKLDSTVVISLEDMIFRDQLENEYSVRLVEGIICISSVQNEKTVLSILPAKIGLQQNYPNPFNPITTISFSLPKTSHVSLKIYNLLGEQISTLYTGIKNAGVHSIDWDGYDSNGIKMSSGIYFYRLSVAKGEWVKSKKMLLIR